MLQSRAAHTLASACEHRRGPIDADQVSARAPERQGDAAGATSELESWAPRVQGKLTPERNVAPAERTGILPVIERRVVIPSFPALRMRTGTYL